MARLGIRAMIGGLLASYMTAAIAGNFAVNLKNQILKNYDWTC